MAIYTKEIISWRSISEGGYVNDPNDPGGPTNFGITLKTLANWRGVRWQDLPIAEVKDLTMDEANKIYKRNYWDTVSGDDLPQGLDYAVYDYGIHSGPAKSIKDLQRTIGVSVDGIIGSGTLNALKKANLESVIVAYCDRRYAYMETLSNFKRYKTGWTRRVMGKQLGVQENDIGVVDRAVRLSRNEKSIPAPQGQTIGKALPEKENPWNKPEVLSVAGSAIAAVLGAVVGSPIIQYSLAAAIVTASLLAGYYAVRRIRAMEVD